MSVLICVALLYYGVRKILRIKNIFFSSQWQAKYYAKESQKKFI